jgi:hypothetical protein
VNAFALCGPATTWHKTSGLTRLLHPQAGPWTCTTRTSRFPGPVDAHHLSLTYHTERGSESEQRLRLLAALAEPSAARREEARPRHR